MEGSAVIPGGNDGKNLMWFAGGVAVTLLVHFIYVKKKFGVNNFAQAIEKARDEGNNEAHDTMRQLLIAGHNNGMTPGDVLAVMEGRLKVA